MFIPRCLLLNSPVATVGTTSSGAVDNMSEIKEVGTNILFTDILVSIFLINSSAKDYPWLWVHVDAAWAGSALCCPEYRDKLYLKEINSFVHSFCTSFHKVCDVISIQAGAAIERIGSGAL